MTAPAYAGIGSRATPAPMLALIRQVAHYLAREGWTLRSGGAQGADSAFCQGAEDAGGGRQIFLPWEGFNGQTGPYTIEAVHLPGYKHAMELAHAHHPAWDTLKAPVRRLMARNAFQVGGPCLRQRSAFVLCWAPGSRLDEDGKVVDVAGGTGLAVRLAVTWKIPVFNLDLPEHRERVTQRLEQAGQD